MGTNFKWDGKALALTILPSTVRQNFWSEVAECKQCQANPNNHEGQVITHFCRMHTKMYRNQEKSIEEEYQNILNAEQVKLKKETEAWR